jgi:hypothetical protein
MKLVSQRGTATNKITFLVVLLAILVLVILAPQMVAAHIGALSELDVPYQSMGDPVVINPFFSPADVTVSSSQTIVVRWGWKAATAGIVRRFIRNTEQSHLLDGSLLFATSFPNEGWGRIQRDDPAAECGSVRRPTMLSWWTLDVGSLAPGDYLLQSTIELGNELSDGCDWDNDGVLETLGPGVILDRVITIHVTP